MLNLQQIEALEPGAEAKQCGMQALAILLENHKRLTIDVMLKQGQEGALPIGMQ